MDTDPNINDQVHTNIAGQIALTLIPPPPVSGNFYGTHMTCWSMIFGMQSLLGILPNSGPHHSWWIQNSHWFRGVTFYQLNYNTHRERVGHIYFFVGAKNVSEYFRYSLEVLPHILIAFCGMRRSRIVGSIFCGMKHKLGGFYCIYGMADYHANLDTSAPDNKLLSTHSSPTLFPGLHHNVPQPTVSPHLSASLDSDSLPSNPMPINNSPHTFQGISDYFTYPNHDFQRSANLKLHLYLHQVLSSGR